MLLSKYCQNSSFMECKLPSRPSHGWRSILEGRKVLEKGLGWLVTNGRKTRIWSDPWLSTTQPLTPIGPANRDQMNLCVSSLIDETTNQWNWNRISEILPGYEAIIHQLPQPTSRGEDTLSWLPIKSGIYSSRSGYGACSIEEIHAAQVQFNWQSHQWKLHSLPKIRSFLWKAASDALPVGIQLVRRNISPSSACKRCGDPESTTHMLFHCEFAEQVWRLAPIHKGTIPLGSSVLDTLRVLKKATILPPIGLVKTDLFSWICCHIWKARNQLFFTNTHFSAIEIITKSIQDALSWQSAQQAIPVTRRPQVSSVPPHHQCGTSLLYKCGVAGAFLYCRCRLGISSCRKPRERPIILLFGSI